MKKYYSEYVGHCARFYFRTDRIHSPSESRVDYNNFISVSNVLDRYDAKICNLLRFVYTADKLLEAVSEYSFKNNTSREEVWYTIQKFEKEVAVERGLL